MQSVYILDYDADIVDALSKWFSQHSFSVEGFTDSRQLLSRLLQSQPDSIILDTLYGGLQATTDLCHKIRKILHYRGRIFLTTTNKIGIKEIEECGAAASFSKPFDLQEVLAGVSRMIA